MVNHFEARLGRMPVHGGNRAQTDEFLVVLEIAAQIDDLRRVGDQRGFAERLDGFENRRMASLWTSPPYDVLGNLLGTDQSSAPFFHT